MSNDDDDKKKAVKPASTVAAFDQAMAEMVRTWPGGLWSFNKALEAEGFAHSDAMVLTAELLRSLSGARG